MHKLVQHCILEKWSGDDWAKELEDKFFVVTMALCDVSRLGYLSKDETQDIKGLLSSVVDKYLNSCLGDVEELWENSNCTSVSHVCRPILFLRSMFARACELPFEEFNKVASQNSGTSFVDAVAIAKNTFQAFCTGFFLLRSGISKLLKKEKLWSLIFEKLLLHGRRTLRVNLMEADFLWKLCLRDDFFKQFLVVQDQLVCSFDLLSQSSYSCSERCYPNNMQRTNRSEEQTLRIIQEALCNIMCQIATQNIKELQPATFSTLDMLENTLEHAPAKHHLAAGNILMHNRMESAAEISNGPPNQLPVPTSKFSAGLESVEQRDKHLEYFLLSTSSQWSLKTAQGLEQCASQILSAWQWDSSAPVPSYADVALAMWSAFSSGKDHLAVKILTQQIKLIKNAGIDQWAEIGRALSALSILLYFKGSLEQVIETVCTLLLFLSWLLTSFDISKRIPESNTQPSLLQTSEMLEAVESELISFLVTCVCKDSLIDDQMTSLTSMCRSCGHTCTATRLYNVSKRVSEERSTAGKLFLRANVPKRC